jgi:hypothetical protein
MTDQELERWDLFISHASEDKLTFVEPLASALSAFGVRVWYDEYTLKIGDSLSRSIDKGLANSDYGLVVLSPAFLAKQWPEYELRGLTARELRGKKIIIPVWHNVSMEDILKFSPPLADKLAVRSYGLQPLQVAIKIIEVVRPDILTKILRRIAHYRAIDSASVETKKLTDIRPSPIRHETLPPDLVSRIRLLRASLIGPYTHSMAFWLDGFKRDAHPSREIMHWEHLAAVYLEYTTMTPNLDAEQHKRVFQVVSSLGDSDEEAAEKFAASLPADALIKLRELISHTEPVYDIDEKLPFADLEGKTSSFEYFDREHFPKDLPEGLVREIMGTQATS